MGWGDELIVSAQVRAMQRTDPRPVTVIDIFGRPRWSLIWENNPRIARDHGTDRQCLLSAPNARPYIESKSATHWRWKPYRCEPGEIYFSLPEHELAHFARSHVIVEPNVKARPEAMNKAWSWSRWQALVDLKLAPMAQVGPPGARRLDGVRFIATEGFRQACAVLNGARAYVGPEGGLHHAAAALGVPAVVLFGSFISPESTGYEAHKNIYRGAAACGSRLPCVHCREAMDSITVEEVAAHLAEVLA